jgi:hypothetical protein
MQRLRRIFSRTHQKTKKMDVYALVGETGTGKSFRARLVMEKYAIDLMVDDGLLIRDQRILAGKSAKREKNRVTAIKRAIFQDSEHARDIRKTLHREKFRSILLIGTSDKMVARISERLHLPYPGHIIYIDDVATEEEIQRARESRKMRGKHVIPVPVIEVKQDPSHRILDSIKIFLKSNPFLFWKKRSVEKTVVQPPFSRLGRLSISENALSQMIIHCVHEFSPNIDIQKIVIDFTTIGYKIEVKVACPYGMPIQNSLGGLQEYIGSNIERYTGIHIEELHVTVEVIKSPPKSGHETNPDKEGRGVFQIGKKRWNSGKGNNGC